MEIKIDVSDRGYSALSRIAEALEKLALASANALNAEEMTLIKKAESAAKPAQKLAEAPTAAQTPAEDDTAPWEEKKPKDEPAKKTPVKEITDDELRNVAARAKDFFNSTDYIRQALMTCGAKSVSAVPAGKRQQFIDFLEKKMGDELPY